MVSAVVSVALFLPASIYDPTPYLWFDFLKPELMRYILFSYISIL
jgi:hypothetical protein